MRIPSSVNVSPKALAFLMIWPAYVLKSSDKTSLNEVAFAAIMCINGPPCIPGKTALSIPLAYFSLHKIIPPRGPRNVLCVVVVTKSAYGTGLGRSEEHTSELQSRFDLVCRLLLEKKNVDAFTAHNRRKPKAMDA